MSRSSQQGNHFACAPPEWPATRERERGLAHPPPLSLSHSPPFFLFHQPLSLLLSLPLSLFPALRSNRRKRDKDEGNFSKTATRTIRENKNFLKKCQKYRFPRRITEGSDFPPHSGWTRFFPIYRIENSAWVNQAADSELELVN